MRKGNQIRHVLNVFFDLSYIFSVFFEDALNKVVTQPWWKENKWHLSFIVKVSSAVLAFYFLNRGGKSSGNMKLLVENWKIPLLSN